MNIPPLVALALPDPDDQPSGTEPPKPSPTPGPPPSRQLAHQAPSNSPATTPPAGTKRKPLTPKQEAFVDAYLGVAKYDAQRAAMIASQGLADPLYLGQLAYSYLQ